MKTDIDEVIIQQAIDTYGTSNQVNMAIEECAELINALEKYRRGRVTRNEVREEIADVQIMCAQLELIFGECKPERMRKIDRLRGRLENNKENKL